MREKFLNAVHEEMYLDPESISFVQYIRRTPQNVVEKFLIHKTKNDKIIAERWRWDWNKEFANLAVRKNIELVKKGEYASVLSKNTTIVREEKVTPLMDLIRSFSITPQDFEFSNMRMLNDGPGYDLRIKSYSYQVKATWSMAPKEWGGLKEVVEGIVAVVEAAVR
jgi:hypothetical protein